MNYEIELTEDAIADIQKFKNSGNKKILSRINKLLDELRIHPTTGTGNPKTLKHYKTKTWSRKISDKHRLIYRIQNNEVIVLVLSFWGYYDDK